MDLLPLVVALLVWINWQTFLAIPIGFGLQVVSLVILEMDVRRHEVPGDFRRRFYRVNVWLLLPVLLIGFTFGLAHFYPRPYSHLALLMIILGQYLIQGMILEFLLKRHLTH